MRIPAARAIAREGGEADVGAGVGAGDLERVRRRVRHPHIAAVFEETAHNEREHAQLFYAHLAKLAPSALEITACYPVVAGSTAAQLKAAAMGAVAFQKGLGACHSLAHPHRALPLGIKLQIYFILGTRFCDTASTNGYCTEEDCGVNTCHNHTGSCGNADECGHTFGNRCDGGCPAHCNDNSCHDHSGSCGGRDVARRP